MPSNKDVTRFARHEKFAIVMKWGKIDEQKIRLFYTMLFDDNI